MRIGILTLPLHINYGGILQAYALQTVLERMGHEVVVYQRSQYLNCKLPYWKYPLSYSKRILIKLFIDKKQVIFVEKKKIKELPVIRQNTNRFIQDYIHTSYIKKPSDIDLSNIDCIIVGSDQIWRPYHVHNLYRKPISEVYLKFAEGWNGKKIAYAVSFGVEEWEYTSKQTKECKRLARLFDAISVREKNAVRLCSENLGIDTIQVLDPTLLLSSKDYMKMIRKPKEETNNRMLFYYILDETADKMQLVEKLAKDKNLSTFYTYSDTKKKKELPIEKRVIPSIEDWLLSFFQAKFVITDSFHGCVFSIIFGKPFVAIGNKKRGNDRFSSLLELFHLEKNLLLDPKDYVAGMDFSLPNNICDIWKNLAEKSRKFLIESLGRK